MEASSRPSTSSLSGVRACLVELGIIGDKSDLYCPAVRDAIDNYKKMIEENMYPDDGLFHDEQRIEIFRAMLTDMVAFYYASPKYGRWAPILEAMQLLQCGLSTRPSESLVTNISGLEAADVADTSFDSTYGGDLEDFTLSEDARCRRGTPRSRRRRAFLAQQCVVIYGTGEGDAEYVNFCDLGHWSNPKGLPILGPPGAHL